MHGSLRSKQRQDSPEPTRLSVNGAAQPPSRVEQSWSATLGDAAAFSTSPALNVGHAERPIGLSADIGRWSRAETMW
jgi:hypothetical protein